LTTTATHQEVRCRVRTLLVRPSPTCPSLPEKAIGFLRKPTEGWLGARDAPCTYSAKLKIFNLPKHIQLLRFGLAALTEPLRIPLVQRSAGRWVVAH
jgi:hypothetical protein